MNKELKIQLRESLKSVEDKKHRIYLVKFYISESDKLDKMSERGREIQKNLANSYDYPFRVDEQLINSPEEMLAWQSGELKLNWFQKLMRL